jgi:hypothetical protein
VDIGKGRAADSFGRLVLNPPFSQVQASGRWDWQRRAFSAVAVGVRLFDHRGDSLELRYDRLLETGTGRMRASLDALFGLTRYWPASAAAELAFNQVSASWPSRFTKESPYVTAPPWYRTSRRPSWSASSSTARA